MSSNSNHWRYIWIRQIWLIMTCWHFSAARLLLLAASEIRKPYPYKTRLVVRTVEKSYRPGAYITHYAELDDSQNMLEPRMQEKWP